MIDDRPMREKMSTYRYSSPYNDEDVVELLRRAIVQGDQDARAWMQQRLGEVVRGWLRHHPNKEAAFRLDSEDNYVALVFERFWRLTIDQQVEYSSLAIALSYLRVSLHGAVLDTLRTYSRPKEAPSPQLGFPKELPKEDVPSSAGVWELLQGVHLTVREQRLAYLLFHCGLGPKEIVQRCLQEFSDVCEINRLRRTILERLLRN